MEAKLSEIKKQNLQESNLQIEKFENLSKKFKETMKEHKRMEKKFEQ